MRFLFDKLTSHWAARSFGVGVAATALDVAALLLLARGLRLATPVASALAVLLGCAASFLLNKFLAFRDARTPLLPQAARYAATTALSTVLQASLMYALADRLGLPLLVAKLAADLLVFGCGSLVTYRFVVFREAFEPAPSLPPPAPARASAAAPRFVERLFPRGEACASPPSLSAGRS